MASIDDLMDIDDSSYNAFNPQFTEPGRVGWENYDKQDIYGLNDHNHANRLVYGQDKGKKVGKQDLYGKNKENNPYGYRDADNDLDIPDAIFIKASKLRNPQHKASSYTVPPPGSKQALFKELGITSLGFGKNSPPSKDSILSDNSSAAKEAKKETYNQPAFTSSLYNSRTTNGANSTPYMNYFTKRATNNSLDTSTRTFVSNIVPTNSLLGKRKSDDHPQSFDTQLPNLTPQPKPILKPKGTSKKGGLLDTPTHTLLPGHPGFPTRVGQATPSATTPPEKFNPSTKRKIASVHFDEEVARCRGEHDDIHQLSRADRGLVIDRQNRIPLFGHPAPSPGTVRQRRRNQDRQRRIESFIGTVRGISSAIVTSYYISRCIVNGIVRMFRGAHQRAQQIRNTVVRAVSTDSSDRKRRAVERADGTMEYEGLPGYYPTMPGTPIYLRASASAPQLTPAASGPSDSQDYSLPTTPSPLLSSSSTPGDSQRKPTPAAFVAVADKQHTEVAAQASKDSVHGDSRAPQTPEAEVGPSLVKPAAREAAPAATAEAEKAEAAAAKRAREMEEADAYDVRQATCKDGRRPGARTLAPFAPGPTRHLVPFPDRSPARFALAVAAEKVAMKEREEAEFRERRALVLASRMDELTLSQSNLEADFKASIAHERTEELRREREKQEAEAAERRRIAAEQAENQRLASEQLREEARLREARRIAEEAEQARLATVRGIIPVLSTHAAAAVDTALAVTNPSAVLANTTEGLDLLRGPIFGRLVPTSNAAYDPTGSWLNDDAVDAWFTALCARKAALAGWIKGSKTPPPFATFASQWYNHCKAGDWDMSRLQRWSRRQQIAGDRLLGVQKIFFPVNTGAHWTLLVISPLERKIQYLDSLGGRGGKWAERTARDWLKAELGKKYQADEWSMDFEEGVSELQTNSSDCGVFACWNGLAAAKGRAFGDVKAEFMPDARRAMAAIFLAGGFVGEFDL